MSKPYKPSRTKSIGPKYVEGDLGGCINGIMSVLEKHTYTIKLAALRSVVSTLFPTFMIVDVTSRPLAAATGAAPSGSGTNRMESKPNQAKPDRNVDQGKPPKPKPLTPEQKKKAQEERNKELNKSPWPLSVNEARKAKDMAFLAVLAKHKLKSLPRVLAAELEAAGDETMLYFKDMLSTFTHLRQQYFDNASEELKVQLRNTGFKANKDLGDYEHQDIADGDQNIRVMTDFQPTRSGTSAVRETLSDMEIADSAKPVTIADPNSDKARILKRGNEGRPDNSAKTSRSSSQSVDRKRSKQAPTGLWGDENSLASRLKQACSRFGTDITHFRVVAGKGTGAGKFRHAGRRNMLFDTSSGKLAAFIPKEIRDLFSGKANVSWGNFISSIDSFDERHKALVADYFGTYVFKDRPQSTGEGRPDFEPENSYFHSCLAGYKQPKASA